MIYIVTGSTHYESENILACFDKTIKDVKFFVEKLVAESKALHKHSLYDSYDIFECEINSDNVNDIWSYEKEHKGWIWRKMKDGCYVQ